MKATYPKSFLFLPFILFVFLFNTPVIAGTLTGKFAFKKSVPRGSLIYFSEDHSLAEAPVIDQINQQFTKTIIAGPKGVEATFKNSDTINHNIYANDNDVKVKFDIGLSPPGSISKQKISWEEGALVRISCKIHPKMRAWIASISSKFYQTIQFKKKQKKTQFEIANVPDNLSKIKVWIPGYLPIETNVKPGESKTIELRSKKKKKLRGTLTLTRS